MGLVDDDQVWVKSETIILHQQVSIIQGIRRSRPYLDLNSRNNMSDILGGNRLKNQYLIIVFDPDQLFGVNAELLRGKVDPS